MKRIMHNIRRNTRTSHSMAKHGKEDEKGFRAGILIGCFVATLAVYVMLLLVERAALKAEERVYVYTAAVVVPADTTVTEENVDSYFIRESRTLSSIPEGYITDAGQIIGQITDREYLAKEIITASGFSCQEERVNGIDNPVEVSLNAATLSQVVGGVLRAGDYINIWSVREEGGLEGKRMVAEQICSYAYVSRAFTSSGIEVERGDMGGQATTVVNIIIPADKEGEFNVALANGTIRVGRCLYTNESR